MDVFVGPELEGDITEIEAAIFGPVDPACPDFSTGTFIDCSENDLVKLFVTPQLSRFIPLHQMFLKIIRSGISQV